LPRLPSRDAERSVVAMKASAAIAVEKAAIGDGVNRAERVDAILQGRRKDRQKTLVPSGLLQRPSVRLNSGGSHGAVSAEHSGWQ
jgi:hypothetical protein